MKTIQTLIFLTTVIFSHNVYADNFSPTLLKFSVAPYVAYSFDSSVLNIPFTQTGTPATVVFSVFTDGRSNFVNNVRNGNLGWHYVNLIDTCVYVAPPKHCEPGGNTIEWDSKLPDGKSFFPGEYTFYIWGYDDTSEKKLAVKALPFHWMENGIIINKDTDGIPLSKPIIYDSPDKYRYDVITVSEPVRFMKWELGNNPEDTALISDTFIKEYNSGMYFAVDSEDHKIIYHQTYDWDISGTYYTEKMQWVSGGMAVRDDSWGNNGRFDMAVGKGNDGIKMGVYDIGYNQLLTVWSCTAHNCMDCYLVYIDKDTGSEIRRIDISDTFTWFNANREMDQNRAPTNFSLVNGRLYMHQMYSTIMSCVDPYAEIKENFWLWKNMYGDNHHDYYDENPNFTGISQYTYRGEQDSNYHVISSAYDLGTLSFDLTLPDGTGAGYFSFANEIAGMKRGILYIDSDTAFDGIYSDKSGNVNYTENGWWYIAHDSVKGKIVTDINVTNPLLSLVSFNSGGRFRTGVKKDITWQSYLIEKIKIEFSSDNGKTWIIVADNIEAKDGKFVWTTSLIESEECLIKITDQSNASLSDVSDVTFIIKDSYLKVKFPNGGESLTNNSDFHVTWTSDGVEKINIELINDSETEKYLLTKNYSTKTGTFSCRYPGNLVSGYYFIKITDNEDSLKNDISDSTFYILCPIFVDNSKKPFSFSLSQNTPNPFNPSTTIDFTIPSECYVTLDIYNIYGQKVSTLIDNVLAAGNHSVRWNGSNFSAGVYICRLKAGENVKSIKMLLVK